jgi:hypothetical protein
VEHITSRIDQREEIISLAEDKIKETLQIAIKRGKHRATPSRTLGYNQETKPKNLWS